jgi:hypothetical protein
VVPVSDVEFRVIWEIEIDADSPKQAAEQARALQMSPAMPATVFEVWEHVRQRMHRVDLAVAADRLDKTEMANVRAMLRRLQCSREPQRDIKDMVTVMLIFLDADEAHSGRIRTPGYNRAP